MRQNNWISIVEEQWLLLFCPLLHKVRIPHSLPQLPQENSRWQSLSCGKIYLYLVFSTWCHCLALFGFIKSMLHTKKPWNIYSGVCFQTLPFCTWCLKTSSPLLQRLAFLCWIRLSCLSRWPDPEIWEPGQHIQLLWADWPRQAQETCHCDHRSAFTLDHGHPQKWRRILNTPCSIMTEK